MKEGWIKIHRKLLDSAIFSEPKLLQFWIYCLCKASTKEKEMIVGKQEVKLGKGQFIFGRKKAGADLKISETTAFRNLKFLEKMNMVELQTNNKFTIVTIENWALYQTEGSEGAPQMNNKRTANELQMNSKRTANEHKQEIKELKNNIPPDISKDISAPQKGRFIPPTVGEVKTYCKERGNGVNAEKFVDFYESKGWYVGKNKMRDWKAAVRNWERAGKDKCDKRKRYIYDYGGEEDSII